MRIKFQIVFLLLICLLLSACSFSPEHTDSESNEAPETTQYEDTEEYFDEVPPLKNGYSEMVGPWAYIFYAKDTGTSYVYHDAYDGYIPKNGDLLITGEDYDGFYISDENLSNIHSLGRFDYWHEDFAWNGHILYISDSTGGVLTCFEGNTIAPGQDLDVDDYDYIHKSSIDMVRINFNTGETYTQDKVDEKPVRAVIETKFSDEFISEINAEAATVYKAFYEDQDKVRNDIMSLYPVDIDWCGLFVHYLLLRTTDTLIN